MIPYPSYKDSGVKWIGEIPNGWVLSNVKYLLNDDGFRSGPFGSSLITNQLVESGNYLVYTPEHLTGKKIEYPLFVPFEREDELKKYEIKDGDIVLPIVGTLGRGKLFTSQDKKGILNQRLCRISPNSGKVVLQYLLNFLINTNLVKIQIELEKKGSILDHITREIIFNFQLPLPPHPEQKQIVSFLDNKTQKIDELIEKTEKKIELLKEKRTSLINHCVTKGLPAVERAKAGLNPNVEMKDSGVPARHSHGTGGEWIGEIPSEWDSIRLKYFSTLLTEKEDTDKDDIKISPENVESHTGVCFNLYSEYEGKGVKFKSGDILLNKLRLYLVKILLPDYDGFSMGEMIVIRLNENVSNRYYFYLLFNQGLIDLLDSQSTGIKVPRVSPEIIMGSYLPHPPKEEQTQIVEYLDKQTQKIDSTIEKETQRIELLKEYRQSLISEVVTGKVDVRGWKG